MKRSKMILSVLILVMIALIFSGCGGGNLVTPPIDDELEYVETITDQEGIGTFTVNDGQLSIEVLDTDTEETIENIECFLSTDGTDAVILLVDPDGEYIPRLISCQNESSNKGQLWYGIKQFYMDLKIKFIEGGSHLVYLDEYLPEGLTREILDQQYKHTITTELKNLGGVFRGSINAYIDFGIGFIETQVVTLILTPISGVGGGLYAIESDVRTIDEALESAMISKIADTYENLGYEPDQKFEVWEAKWPSADFGLFLVLPCDIPKSSIHPIAYIDSIDPNPAQQGETVTFNGHGTDPDGEIMLYKWESNIDGLLNNLESFSRSDLSVGTHTISLKVFDTGANPSEVVSESLTVNAITSIPETILSPVVGDLEIVASSEQCSDKKWCFNQHKSDGHCQDGGICQADDTYAWDANLNTPKRDSDNGMPVYAVEEGIISQTYGGCINAGGSRGQLLIEHSYQGNSWWSGYLHLKDIQVATGQSVDKDTLVGYISSTGTDNNHLHFVVYTGQNSQSGLISFNTEITSRDFPQTNYTITAFAEPNGSISPSGDVPVNEGSDQTFTITPDTDYKIADVLVDGSSVGAVSSYTFTNVTKDHTISATFGQTSQPDLIVSNIYTEPNPPITGGYYALGVDIKNQGNADITKTFLLEVYFDDTYMVHFYIDGLTAGVTCRVLTTKYFIWPSDTNLHTIMGIVDPDNIINESNESNNQYSIQVRATEPPVGIIMEEFNGNTIGNSYGIVYTNTINGQGAVFSRVKESRIEYPFAIGFPHEGTIEYLIKVYHGYRYSDYVLNDNSDFARIFDTGGQDVWYPGAIWVDVFDNGTINLGTATAYAQPESHNLKATGTDFAFNEWHTIGISFGSQGQYIMLDGNIVAANASYTESLQTCGNFTSAVNVPTVGELVSCFWVNNRHDIGFEGVIDRFRVSEKQKDWYLSNTFPSQY